MKIASVSAANFKSNLTSFKGTDKTPKPMFVINENDPDDKVVMYGNWGGNYVYPITAGQIRKHAMEEQSEHSFTNPNAAYDETPEEYYNRKLYSTEWTM